ncbi:cytochrome b559 subunit alpha [Acaryochloris sp. CCMEE 5410]|uniref:cytochrome b559 subunit alpha n=1 Tax=Acaryochloris sp. CCMEE 5410 TaxID=310037 RepID=UPI000248520D|nr:cytochrome b559 subunit alpha [Acaryochloris sp. CCMEE 5410]KAI9130912.1 cytochrome b559 subunit alpha [Acaryochloris sp. CCMEE 5410]
MAGVTGERPFGEIITDFSFWKLHVINIPAIFISGWLFVSSGLAYDVFGTPHPNEYFSQSESQIQIVTDRYAGKQQIDDFRNLSPSLDTNN